MKKRIHKNRIYVMTWAIASMAFGAAYGTPFLQDSQTKIIESIRSLSSDSREQAELRQTLRRMVETELKQRFEKQEAELKQIEQRLEEAKAKLDQRKSKQNEIVDRRITDLLQTHDDLDWASSTASQNFEVLVPIPKAVSSVFQTKAQSEGLKQLSDSVTATEQRAAIIRNSTSHGALAAKVLEDIFDALKLQAMLEDFSGLSDERKKEKSQELAVQFKLLKLKFELLERTKEPGNSLFETELSVRESSYRLAEKEFEISSRLVKSGAENTSENNRKKAEMELEKARWIQTEREFQNYKDQMETFKKRVSVVRKKYDEIFGAESNSPAKAVPEVK